MEDSNILKIAKKLVITSNEIRRSSLVGRKENDEYIEAVAAILNELSSKRNTVFTDDENTQENPNADWWEFDDGTAKIIQEFNGYFTIHYLEGGYRTHYEQK